MQVFPNQGFIAQLKQFQHDFDEQTEKGIKWDQVEKTTEEKKQAIEDGNGVEMTPKPMQAGVFQEIPMMAIQKQPNLSFSCRKCRS